MPDAQVRIFHAACRIKDKRALAAFVAPIPEGADVATKLRRGFSGLLTRYRDERRAAYYVVSDGKVAMCWTVTGISSDEAAAILSECDSITEWGDVPFNEAVERALGRPIQLVQ